MKPKYLNISEKELSTKVGCMSQICSAKKMMFSEGPAKGLEVIDVNNGAGLSYQILADRGMGIGACHIKGIPVCWISPNEDISPVYYNPIGEAWLETFGGGMLTSCGVTNVGSPTVVDGIGVGLHGRLSHIPARDVSIQKTKKNDEYFITVEGTMIDGRVMGPSFSVHRTYTIMMGKNEIRLYDQITNLTDTKQPVFALYHVNIGYPFLSETAELSIADLSDKIAVKDDSYLDDYPNWNRFSNPIKGMTERVYYHTLEKKSSESAICLKNSYSDCNLELRIAFPLSEINHLVEWKMLGYGNYILGLEPGNTFASGRDYSFTHNDVEFLEPYETKDIHLTISLSVKEK